MCIIYEINLFLLLQVPCKIVHVSRGSDLMTHLVDIKKHFVEFGSPAMMGMYSLFNMNGYASMLFSRNFRKGKNFCYLPFVVISVTVVRQ